MIRQVLIQDYSPAPLCRYCGGRGFTLVEQHDNRVPEKIIKPSIVIECKFCGGQGYYGH